MNVEHPHAVIRSIHKLEVGTPLIVPSFSSRGIPYVSDVWNEFKHKLYGVCLVSAYDISEGLIPSNASDSVDVLIVDSGQYETKGEGGSGETSASSTIGEWSRAKYHETVSDIRGDGNVILVNFDENGGIEAQFENASGDFSRASHAASDFLVKPADCAELVNVPKLVRFEETLKQFDIVGITAREAGTSFLRRCSSVVTLRNLLDDMGLSTPIHVFGAINPYEVLTYFLCGADIFDGLNWLRLAFRGHSSIPVDELVMEDMKWNLSDPDFFAEEWTRNLQILYELQEALRRYSAHGGLESLTKKFPIAGQAACVAEIAGAEIRK